MSAEAALVFVFGAFLGSFLNVCIYRLPRKESIIWPGSKCPACAAPVPLWLNVPIISYLLLRGRCSKCNIKISPQYLVVEVLSAIFLVFVWRQYSFSITFIQYSVLILLLLTISFIDIRTKLILNVLTVPGLIIGLALSPFSTEISLLQSMLGVLVGGGFLWAIGISGEMVFKQESMGGGDVKLGAMIGAFLGPKVVIALFLAFFLALPVIAVGLGFRKLQFGSKVPFGPFISLGSLLILFLGPFLLQKYMEVMGVVGQGRIL